MSVAHEEFASLDASLFVDAPSRAPAHQELASLDAADELPSAESWPGPSRLSQSESPWGPATWTLQMPSATTTTGVPLDFSHDHLYLRHFAVLLQQLFTPATRSQDGTATQVCTAALKAAAAAAADHAGLDLVELCAADAQDGISFQPLEDQQVAYMLNDSKTPVTEATLRRLYLDGEPYHRNPFTNEPLTKVAAVVVRVRGD